LFSDTLQAVFQGHISGRRLQGVKSNPIYHDKQKPARTSEVSEHDFNITVYNSFPLKRQRNVDYGDPPFLPSGEENPNYSGSVAKVTNSPQGKDMQRESLKVTNGDVVVGDIIIETDYRKTPQHEEDVVSEIEKITKTKNLYCDSMTSENNNVENLDKKQELDDVNESSGKHLLKESTNAANGKPAGMKVSTMREDESDWPDIDDLVVPKETELWDTDKFESENVSESLPHEKENGSLTQEKINGVVSNGNTDSNGLHVNGKIPNGNHLILEEETESKKSKKSKKNSKKKVRERKNSLPDHILNSLSMKPKKPILIPTCSDSTSSSNSDANRLNSSITEQKSVKFSKDTVFNENKSNKYRKEKVQDRYRQNGLANSNPVFVDDNGFEISLTDDEKVLHFSNSSDTNSQVSSFKPLSIQCVAFVQAFRVKSTKPLTIGKGI
jgi:hypothetical protein